MQVKFREGVPEEIQDKIREFLFAAGFTEAMYGFPVNYVEMCQYLHENDCIAAIHVYGIEVLPAETWVKEEVASFPPDTAEYYKKLLRESLARKGFPTEKIDKWMDDATVGKRMAEKPCNPDYKKCISEILKKFPNLSRQAQNGSRKAKRDIVALCLHRLNGYLNPKFAFIYLDTLEKLAKSANPQKESATCSTPSSSSSSFSPR
jgi:hypothetical protein